MLEGQMDRNAPTENQNSVDVQASVQMLKGCSTDQTTYVVTRRCKKPLKDILIES